MTKGGETGDGSVSPFPQNKETQNRPLSPPVSPLQISTVDVPDFTDYNKGKMVLGRYGVEI